MTTPTTSTTVPIDFCNDAAAVPLPHTRIVATRDAGDAPRSSRYVSFVDDGKLFEGHLTVQSRSLKSILQHLVDRQEEQALVLRALQDDVTSLQATATRAARIEQRMSVLYSGGGASAAAAATVTATAANATGSTGSAASTHELSTLRRRLTALEHFVTLWGAKAKDVSEMVQRHGEPIVTPDAYTAYLLELAPFRATRREARATALSAATTTTTTSGNNNGSALAAAAASAAVHGSELGTAARRRLTALSALQPGNMMATAGSGSGGADDVAQRALQTAEQAMTLLRELQQQRHVMPRLSSMPPAAAAGDGDGDAETAATTSGKPRSDSAAGGVDVQARSDIAQLHDYLQRKMTEIDARLTLATLSGKAAAAAAAHGSGGSHATTAAGAVGRHAARRTSNQRASVTAAGMPAATQTLPSSSSTAAPPQETIDAVARDDAAASLALIEELESVVDRRLRELAMSIANLSLQVHNNNNNNNNGNSNSGSVTSDTSAVADAGSSDRTPRRSKAHASSRPHAAAVASSPSRASDDNKGGGASNTSHVAAAAATTSPTAAATTVVAVAPPVVDTVARDELTSLAEHVADMEDDARRRWQTLEERLRVLGRACMSRPVAFAAATSPSSMVTGAAAAAAAAAMSSGGVAYDRKAREDAALSLMRIAHVERDVQTLRRLVQGDAATATTARACATVVDACRDGDESAAPATVAAPTPLRDTYGGRVYMLEAEVQQRMAEVNRAIALLRDSERRHDVNVDVDVDKLLSEHSRRDGDTDAHAATQMPQQQQRDDDNNKDDDDEDTRSMPAAAAAATSASLPGVLVLHSHDKAATRAAIAAAPQTQRSDHGDGAATRVRAHDATPTRYARSYSHDTSATTVAMRTSRLRSPDARVFCAPLVEQVTMAVSLPTSARSGSAAANNDNNDDDDSAATRTAASRLVHTTTTPRGGSVAQPTADAHDNNRSDDDNDVVGTRLRPHKSNAAAMTAAAAATMPTDTSRPRAHARRGERASVLRAQHAQPCVIADCAWCAGEAEALRSASTATAAAAHS